jgi:UDP-N-acetylglucosamine 2-epimerase
MKVVSVVGARPQFIKSAPVSRELRKNSEEILIHTGQHYDRELSQTFFDELHLREPDYNLGIGSGSHGYQTAAMLKGIGDILLTTTPDMVLVYGDTNSTLAGALAAAKGGIPLAHVEAGLRSYNKTMPEEINRIVADHCSDILFCPTHTAVSNLKKENILKDVNLVGDVMYDALLYYIDLARKTEILNKLHIEPKKYLLATLHRQSNTDSPDTLKKIVKSLSQIHRTIIFPMHPRTRRALIANGIVFGENIRGIDPVGYLEFLNLECHAEAILTDSGGVQKEAYLLQVPCITLREETEWVETVEDGWNVLVGSNTDYIVKMAHEFRPDKKQRQLFGDGTAAQKIVKILEEYTLKS